MWILVGKSDLERVHTEAGSAAKVAVSVGTVPPSVASSSSQPQPPSHPPQKHTVVGPTVAASAASGSDIPPPPSYPPPSWVSCAVPLAPGQFSFGGETGVIVAPPPVPPSGGFWLSCQGGCISCHEKPKRVVASTCPSIAHSPAGMQWSRGSFKAKLPGELLQFVVQFVTSQAKDRAIIGWGLSWGAKWLSSPGSMLACGGHVRLVPTDEMPA